MKNKTVKKLTTIVATSAVIASSVVTPVLGAQLPDTKDNADGKNEVEQGKKDILASQQDKENDYEVAKQQFKNATDEENTAKTKYQDASDKYASTLLEQQKAQESLNTPESVKFIF